MAADLQAFNAQALAPLADAEREALFALLDRVNAGLAPPPVWAEAATPPRTASAEQRLAGVLRARPRRPVE